MKKIYQGIGWKYGFFAIVVNVIQLLMVKFVPDSIQEMQWFQWGVIVIPMYLIGFPVIWLLTHKTESMPLEKHNLGFGKFIICVFIGAGICGVGSIIGTVINLLIMFSSGSSADVNPILDMMTGSDAIYRITVVGILAPIFEELIFRKLIIDKAVKYGEWVAILMSGLMFGLFHGNFAQFFFATGLGIFWAYIYVRTGKIWYTILFHMVINLTTSVITMYIYMKLPLDKMEELSLMTPEQLSSEAGMQLTMEVLPGMVIYFGWCGFLGLCALIGIILLCCNAKKFYLKHSESKLSKKEGIKAATLNGGMIFYFVIMVAMFVLYYVSL